MDNLKFSVIRIVEGIFNLNSGLEGLGEDFWKI